MTSRAPRQRPPSIGGAIADVIVITGKLVWTLLCVVMALVALGVLAVIVVAIMQH